MLNSNRGILSSRQRTRSPETPSTWPSRPNLPNTPLREPLWGPDLVVGRRKIRQLDAGGRCRICPGMEIVRRRGCPPRFPFELFWEQQKAYDSGPEKHVWESLEALERAAAREISATILGHISAETARKWLGWALGELYVAGEWCFASTADWWWSRRRANCRKGGPSSSLKCKRCTPRPARVGAAPRGRRHARGSRTQKPNAEQQGAHSSRFPAWVYPLAILIGAFTPPAPQAGEGGGGRPQGLSLCSLGGPRGLGLEEARPHARRSSRRTYRIVYLRGSVSTYIQNCLCTWMGIRNIAKKKSIPRPLLL